MYSQVFPMTMVFAFAEAKTVKTWFHVVLENATIESLISYVYLSVWCYGVALKSWYCLHCCRLPQVKQSRRSMKGKQSSAVREPGCHDL